MKQKLNSFKAALAFLDQFMVASTALTFPKIQRKTVQYSLPQNFMESEYSTGFP